MKLFSYCYDKTIHWSAHRNAPYFLAGVSFIESSFFPIPPDFMLISMGLAQPKNAWYYATITTIFSVLGGLFGYLIGLYGISFLEPYISQSSYHDMYNQIVHWFNVYGIWIIFLAGFTPIPYKLFTIAAGALHMPLIPFIIASWVGRGLRFYLVSLVIFSYGERLHYGIRNYIDRIGWISLILLGFGLFVYWIF